MNPKLFRKILHQNKKLKQNIKILTQLKDDWEQEREKLLNELNSLNLCLEKAENASSNWLQLFEFNEKG